MSEDKYQILLGGRSIGKTQLLLENFEQQLEEALKTLQDNNAHRKFNIFFPKYLYDKMTPEDRVWYYNTHPDCNIYFIDSWNGPIRKLTKNGRLRKVKFKNENI